MCLWADLPVLWTTVNSPVKGSVWSCGSLWSFLTLNKPCEHHAPSSALPFPSLISHSTALYSHQSVYHALRFRFCFQPPYGTGAKIPKKSDPSPAQRSARMGLILQHQPGKPLSGQLQSQPREASRGPVVEDCWRWGIVGLGKEEMLAEGG